MDEEQKSIAAALAAKAHAAAQKHATPRKVTWSDLGSNMCVLSITDDEDDD
jgi:hypothetical protein